MTAKQERRAFIVSQHGALHRPNCPRARRLLNPMSIDVDPMDWPEGLWVAACCSSWGERRRVDARVDAMEWRRDGM